MGHFAPYRFYLLKTWADTQTRHCICKMWFTKWTKYGQWIGSSAWAVLRFSNYRESSSPRSKVKCSISMIFINCWLEKILNRQTDGLFSGLISHICGPSIGKRNKKNKEKDYIHIAFDRKQITDSHTHGSSMLWLWFYYYYGNDNVNRLLLISVVIVTCQYTMNKYSHVRLVWWRWWWRSQPYYK